MAIIVDSDTRLVVPGLTGSEGRFHGLRNRAYGTNLVAGVTPGKGGQDVEGVPVYDTVAEAVSEAGANTSMIFVPARFAPDAIYEAVDAGIRDRHLHHRAHPGARDAARLHLCPPEGRDADRPELPGRALAGQGERRDHPGRGLQGRLDRPRLALRHADVPDRLRGRPARARQLDASSASAATPSSARASSTSSRSSRPIAETKYVVLVGEIGGDEEEKAAAYVSAHMSKPVFSYIAGFSAPPGKTMGHAGAIISGSSGTAAAKKEALEAVGIKVGTTPTEVAELVVAAASVASGRQRAAARA